MAIVVVQWANLLICMKRNALLGFGVGLVFSIGLACLLVYAPGTAYLLKLYPISWRWWLTPLPFALLILLYDRGRKLFLRKQGVNGWVGRETC